MNRFVARDTHRSCLVIPRRNHVSDRGAAQILGDEKLILIAFLSAHLPESNLNTRLDPFLAEVRRIEQGLAVVAEHSPEHLQGLRLRAVS